MSDSLSKFMVAEKPAPPNSEPIVLACAADDGYARPLAVTLFSALLNYRGKQSVKVFIIDGGISASNRDRVEHVLARFETVPEWVTPVWTSVRDLTVSDRYPASIYLRLLIPALLPEVINKVIYLDSDVIVDADLTDLWALDVGTRALLAAQDEGAVSVGSAWGLPNYRELGLDADAPYFNSGVLVFNLARWRERAFAQRVIDYIAAHPNQMRFGEQDALNAVLANEWRLLDRRWNQLVSPWKGHEGRQYQKGILHFVSGSKPWNPAGAHWTNVIYDTYLQRSGWYGSLDWWKYYLPLAIRRKHVSFLRSRMHALPTAEHVV